MTVVAPVVTSVVATLVVSRRRSYVFLLTSKDVLTWHFQTFAAHFRQTSRSADQ